MFPNIRLFVPYLGGEDLGILVLHYAADIGRYTLAVAAVPLYEQFVELLMADSVFRQYGFPNAVADRLEAVVLVFLPAVHIAFDIDGGSVRRPLAEQPLLVSAVVMKTEIEVSACPIRQGLTTGYLCFFISGVVGTCLQSSLIRLQIRIARHYRQMLFFFRCHGIIVI